ncbi:MAG: ATP-binding protein [Pseudomonadota bacterium]
MQSLSARLLLSVSVLLLIFFSTSTVVLENAFKHATERAIHDRLVIQLNMLLSAADVPDEGELRLPESLPEARFSIPGSGLFGQVTDATGALVWRSPSSVGVFVPLADSLTPAAQVFTEEVATDGTPVFALSEGIEWVVSDDETRFYTFSVAEDEESFLAQVRDFRARLLTLFGALTLLMIVILAVILRWVLSPLRRLSREVDDIEAGRRSELGSGYPRELEGLTENANRLIHMEIQRINHYRNTLGNLAHSLKTPLAVIRNSLLPLPSESAGSIGEQVDRMNSIVRYQLQRAAAFGGATLGRDPIQVDRMARMVKESLDKVYADKHPECQLELDPDARFFGDEGDLTEVLGNLMDNAYKYSESRTAVTATSRESEKHTRPGLSIRIEDDGPGIAADDVRRVLSRGVRADEQVDGHGIGLAVVRDIVKMYGGRLEVSGSGLGGACIDVTFEPF